MLVDTVLNPRGVLACIAALVGFSACAHRCALHGPVDSSWAQLLACHDHVELDDRLPIDRAGCYRLALGRPYLPNASTGTDWFFIENPGYVELTSRWHSTGTRTGYLVRMPPRRAPWTDDGVWWPTRDGGAFIDLGTGFFGMILRVHRSGTGYAGVAATYQDIGSDSQRATAELWPVECEKMPANPALDGEAPWNYEAR